MEQQLYMRANSAIKSLFLFQQKLDICGIATIYARKQRYKKLVPISTKEFFRWLAKHSIRNSVLAAFTTTTTTTTKIAFVYASKQRCLNPISTKTLRVNSATKMMLGTWIKSFTTFLFTWTLKSAELRTFSGL